MEQVLAVPALVPVQPQPVPAFQEDIPVQAQPVVTAKPHRPHILLPAV